ncbi:hypothetical protein CAOG_08105 [Capsaspora owczarzaki ATCC 30864]|uniref:Large ribosomal subunit protein mL40 n=1 Tax=Capsaspora owczarzaki (strain ATCC 30864) TaxID=595528 RepID=A0A0D2WYL9_CAPO3|nr:hypothetical protein CAOG_08105 [Capsaspora owczarzaki ATCC 30864]KJE98078.1 hypothetical protein CAOG_008105 [Capsaspora owczarzaki ATCC 30864]|eukprot:XP_004342706.1 hypothetical protein CAOG_08105 [Capsaspora owczarzaki ATCC 30864]
MLSSQRSALAATTLLLGRRALSTSAAASAYNNPAASKKSAPQGKHADREEDIDDGPMPNARPPPRPITKVSVEEENRRALFVKEFSRHRLREDLKWKTQMRQMQYQQNKAMQLLYKIHPMLYLAAAQNDLSTPPASRPLPTLTPPVEGYSAAAALAARKAAGDDDAAAPGADDAGAPAASP